MTTVMSTMATTTSKVETLVRRAGRAMSRVGLTGTGSPAVSSPSPSALVVLLAAIGLGVPATASRWWSRTGRDGCHLTGAGLRCWPSSAGSPVPREGLVAVGRLGPGRAVTPAATATLVLLVGPGRPPRSGVWTRIPAMWARQRPLGRRSRRMDG
jgi:hypothetical protein